MIMIITDVVSHFVVQEQLPSISGHSKLFFIELQHIISGCFNLV